LQQNIARSSVLQLTEAARPFLKGEQPLSLAVPRLNTTKQSKKTTSYGVYDKRLFALLRNLRKRLADEESVPPFVVFNDATLIEMAQQVPQTQHEMLAISGVGLKKLERYGYQFLGLIDQYQAS
jgi:ATP-dependent DNA helicase RecQ